MGGLLDATELLARHEKPSCVVSNRQALYLRNLENESNGPRLAADFAMKQKEEIKRVLNLGQLDTRRASYSTLTQGSGICFVYVTKTTYVTITQHY